MDVEKKAINYVNKLDFRIEGDSSGKYLYDAFIDGYHEAFRWRNIKKELPKNEEIILIQNTDKRVCDYSIIKVFIDENTNKIIDAKNVQTGRHIEPQYLEFIIRWRPIEPVTRNS